ncbi:MAG: CoA transferase [Chloroflexi bacterium]|nr:CoA transferase [Chloroflexota bacterium]
MIERPAGASRTPSGPLAGVAVVELAGLVAAPFCAKLLADLGADVIKVEPPQGDPARRRGPFPQDLPHQEKSGLFLYLNTNKRGITLDPGLPSGRELLGRLMERADLFITDLTRRPARRLALDPARARKEHPALIAAYLTPWGLSGPYADVPGYDLNVWHASGLGYITREQHPGQPPGPPVRCGNPQADYALGLTGAVAALTALYYRNLTGRGQALDVSGLEALAFMPMAPLAFPQLDGRVVGRGTEARYPGGLLSCQDGQVLFGLVEEHQFQHFFELMGMPAWAQGGWWQDRQARLDNAEFLTQEIGAWLSARRKADVIREAQARRVPIAAPFTSADLFADEHLQARGFFVQADHPVAGPLSYPSTGLRSNGPGWSLRRPAPLLGQHNEEVYEGLLELTRRELTGLREAGVV